MKRTGWCLLMAGGLAVPSQASSPEPPVKAVLRPRAAVFGPQGRSALQLRVTVKDKKDKGEYTVEVKRTAPRPVAGLERGAPKSLASAAVTAAQDLALDDVLETSGSQVVHARYEVEIRGANGYHGFLIVDQAFARGADGSLQPIDFAEEMRLKASEAPVVLSPDAQAAGGNAPRPVQD